MTVRDAPVVLPSGPMPVRSTFESSSQTERLLTGLDDRLVRFARPSGWADTLSGFPHLSVVKISAGRRGTLIGRYSGAVPAWAQPLLREFAEILSLPRGWNSYNARPIDPQSVADALNLLHGVMPPSAPVPIVTPTNGGGILLEWHTRGMDIELSPLPNETYSLYWRDLRAGDENEIEDASDVTPLAALLQMLTDRA